MLCLHTYISNKDDDVLDTWFSSGLLPLSALGWKGREGESIPVSIAIHENQTGVLNVYL